MSKEDMIKLVQSFNGSLDVQFLEGLTKAQLRGYAEHLKAVRMKTHSAGVHVSRAVRARTGVGRVAEGLRGE